MEYVANAQGQDVASASVLEVAVQPAPVGADAPLAAAQGAGTAVAASPAPVAVSPSRIAKLVFVVALIAARVRAFVAKVIL
jgi:hypothetical protein